MRSSLGKLWLLGTVGLVACGGTSATPSLRSYSAQQALTQNAEMLEFETPAVRQELFRELVRAAQLEEGRSATSEPVLFPMDHDGALVGAPGLDSRADLLLAPDAGVPLMLVFPSRPGEGWSEDRRDSLQGLSEREAVELVARSLLAQWNIQVEGSVQVDRAAGAPYAAAYVAGILRVNPAFVYMAASVNPASSAVPLQ